VISLLQPGLAYLGPSITCRQLIPRTPLVTSGVAVQPLPRTSHDTRGQLNSNACTGTSISSPQPHILSTSRTHYPHSSMSQVRQALAPLRTLPRRQSTSSSTSSFSPGTPTASYHTTSPTAQPSLTLGGGLSLDIFDAPARLGESSARLRSAANAALASAFGSPTAAPTQTMGSHLPPAPVTTLHIRPHGSARAPSDGWVPARPIVTWSGTPPTADGRQQGIVFDGPARPRPVTPAMRAWGFSEPPDPSSCRM
jgi:hypothetical protein